MTGRHVVTPRELGLVAAVLVLPVALVQTGSSLPLLGRSASHVGTPVALGVQAVAAGGRQEHVSTNTTTSNERARPATHVRGTASFDRTAGDQDSGGVPPAQGDPGRAGDGGSGAGSPGTPAEPAGPSAPPRDPDHAPPDDGAGGASDPGTPPSPAPSPPEPTGEPDPAPESRDPTASLAAAGAEAEITVGGEGAGVDIAVGPPQALALELTVNGRPLLR
jgi:hypothetical protein